jgi:hypothetical protein
LRGNTYTPHDPSPCKRLKDGNGSLIAELTLYWLRSQYEYMCGAPVWFLLQTGSKWIS